MLNSVLYAAQDVRGSVGRNRTLRVLVLDEEIPYPPNSGKRIRTWNLLKRLAKRHWICLLCYGSSDDPGVRTFQEAGISLHLVDAPANPKGWRLYVRLFFNLFSPYPYSVTKHYSLRFQKKLDALLRDGRWDLIQCEWTPYARFLPAQSVAPLLVATHNVEAEILARRADQSKHLIANLFFRIQEWKMRRFERQSLCRATSVTAVTTKDAETIRGWGVESVRLVTNGTDLRSYSADSRSENDGEILFLASLDWFPNIDALYYFINDIFPMIRTLQPEATLRVVGRRPSVPLKNRCLAIAGVDFVGEVEDVAGYLSEAAVVVVPLRIGGGSRLKILEALAAGKAVVSTSIGAEGLDVVSGEHLLVSDAPADFAAQVAKLLGSQTERARLGQQGRMLAEKRYAWDQISASLEESWYELSKKPRPSHLNS